MKPATTVQPIRKTGLPAGLAAGAESAAGLIADSLSANTRRAYQGALARLDAAVGGGTLNDEALAAYIGTLETDGRSPACAATAVAAAKFRARFNRQPSPAGRLTEAVLKGMRRRAARKPRPRGQATGITLAEAQTMLAIAPNPRPRGRKGEESSSQAVRRGLVDAVIVALLFQAGLRRSEAARLTWGDIRDAEDSDGILIDVRFSKSNQEGDTDVRFVKGAFARAIRRLRTERNDRDAPGQLVLGLSPQQIGRRFSACAKAAGLDGRYTAHSGRVGLASELTRRGAPTAAVQLAGGWRSARMVTHYSSGATAERGAVAKYL